MSEAALGSLAHDLHRRRQGKRLYFLQVKRFTVNTGKREDNILVFPRKVLLNLLNLTFVLYSKKLFSQINVLMIIVVLLKHI